MSYDNKHPRRKDKRKPYYKKCEQLDRTCRPGGSCPYCQGNRHYNDKVKRNNADEQIREYDD